jgi:sulfite exporter TauE/SafE
MSNALTLGAAFLLGLVASTHCVVMCGGISAALGLATAKNSEGRPRALLLVGYQAGRISSYALAGLLFAGVLGGAIAMLDADAVRGTLRALSAAALMIGALVAFGRVRDPGSSIGRRLWPKLAPLGRRLLPVTSLPRAFAFGMVWGWMPCGFVYTVLLIATLQVDALARWRRSVWARRRRCWSRRSARSALQPSRRKPACATPRDPCWPSARCSR